MFKIPPKFQLSESVTIPGRAEYVTKAIVKPGDKNVLEGICCFGDPIPDIPDSPTISMASVFAQIDTYEVPAHLLDIGGVQSHLMLEPSWATLNPCQLTWTHLTTTQNSQG